MIKNFCIFYLKNFLLTSTPLQAIEQSISNFNNFALAIMDAKIVVEQFFSLTNYIKAQTFCIHKPK